MFCGKKKKDIDLALLSRKAQGVQKSRNPDRPDREAPERAQKLSFLAARRSWCGGSSRLHCTCTIHFVPLHHHHHHHYHTSSQLPPQQPQLIRPDLLLFINCRCISHSSRSRNRNQSHCHPYNLPYPLFTHHQSPPPVCYFAALRKRDYLPIAPSQPPNYFPTSTPVNYLQRQLLQTLRATNKPTKPPHRSVPHSLSPTKPYIIMRNFSFVFKWSVHFNLAHLRRASSSCIIATAILRLVICESAKFSFLWSPLSIMRLQSPF